MTKRNSPGYLLPEVLQPDENICICVPVPKDWGHIRAFLGQIVQLGYWYTWERDAGHNARLAAEPWRDIYQCINEEVNCIMSTGCGCSDDTLTQGRINSDGYYETYDPNTDLWNVNTDSDPRFTGTTYPPLEGEDGSDKRCQAANSLVTVFKAEQQKQANLLSTGAGFAEFDASITGFLVGAAIITGGVTGVLAVITTLVAAFVAGLVASEFEAAFTDETWAELLCIFFCNMEDDASFTQSQFTSVKNEASALGGTAGNFLSKLVLSLGTIGLTNYARSGRAGALSCDGCECDVTCGFMYEPFHDHPGFPGDYGHVLERGDDYMIVESAGGGAYITLQANDYNNCCWLAEVEVLSGSCAPSGRLPCGEDFVDHINSGTPVEQCNSYIEIQPTGGYSGVFTVRLTFGPCP